MHHRMDNILTRIRQDLAHHLDPESIRSACRSIGHTWRQTTLDPVARQMGSFWYKSAGRTPGACRIGCRFTVGVR